MPPTDGELVARISGGDKQAFVCLVDRHKDRIVGYLARLTRDRHLAEDLAQEAFLKLYRYADRLDAERGVTGYLYKIATNLAHSELRRRTRRQWLKERFLLPSGNGGPPRLEQEAHLEKTELQQRVGQAVFKLPLHYRTAVIMHDLQGVSYADIAAATGASFGTVKSRIFRGRQLLKGELGPYLNGAEWSGA